MGPETPEEEDAMTAREQHERSLPELFVIVASAEDATALAPLGEQAGVLEHGEVLAHRGARDVERRRDLAGGELVVGHQAQDRAAPRLHEGAQGDGLGVVVGHQDGDDRGGAGHPVDPTGPW